VSLSENPNVLFSMAGNKQADVLAHLHENRDIPVDAAN
jgi:uncharacterized Zn finger protein